MNRNHQRMYAFPSSLGPLDPNDFSLQVYPVSTKPDQYAAIKPGGHRQPNSQSLVLVLERPYEPAQGLFICDGSLPLYQVTGPSGESAYWTLRQVIPADGPLTL